jgi:hypothetical protein
MLCVCAGVWSGGQKLDCANLVWAKAVVSSLRFTFGLTGRHVLQCCVESWSECVVWAKAVVSSLC